MREKRGKRRLVLSFYVAEILTREERKDKTDLLFFFFYASEISTIEKREKAG